MRVSDIRIRSAQGKTIVSSIWNDVVYDCAYISVIVLLFHFVGSLCVRWTCTLYRSFNGSSSVGGIVCLWKICYLGLPPSPIDLWMNRRREGRGEDWGKASGAGNSRVHVWFWGGKISNYKHNKDASLLLLKTILDLNSWELGCYVCGLHSTRCKQEKTITTMMNHSMVSIVELDWRPTNSLRNEIPWNDVVLSN